MYFLLLYTIVYVLTKFGIIDVINGTGQDNEAMYVHKTYNDSSKVD